MGPSAAHRLHTRSAATGDNAGAWKETSEEEIALLAIILYFGLVKVSSFHRYWSTKTLYHGLWAREIMKGTDSKH